jgi:outer membrane cobalamin receptor
LGPFVSLSASYSPGFVVDDFSAQLERNRFIALNQKQLLVYPVKDKVDLSITFESAKVYDVTVGFSTFTSDIYPYFTNHADGKYYLATTNSTVFNVHADLRIHPSSAGYFISSFQMNAVKDTAGNFLPNYPEISAYAVYGYTLQKGITLKAGGKFMSKRYIDNANTETLPLYISLFGELGYSFSREFLLTAKIDNLLDRKNLIFKGYQDRPLTLEIGIEFQW